MARAKAARHVTMKGIRDVLLQLLSNYLWSWDDRVGAVLAELPGPSANPHQAVRDLTDEQLQQLAAAGFGARLERAQAHQQAYLAGAPRTRKVAYFSAEFGLHECLPIYSGGLGVLAGDHIKSASDLALPLVAVGLIYRHGYFRQHIDGRGQQHEEYPELRPEERGLRRVALADGRPLEISLRMDGRHLNVQVWQANVGRVPLYLLDTNLDSNQEMDRWITSHLYGGDRDTRIKQEIVLGVAGFRALRALGWDSIETFHLNEGHAALLCLEAMREFVARGASLGWAQARAAERIVFTTHTPVPAGHDTFAPELVTQYLSHYAAEDLRCELSALLELGGVGQSGEHFSMTELALNVCRAANGVSRRHGSVTRALFPTRPIDHITNGVHHLTWVSRAMKQLFDTHLPGWREDPECLARAPLLLPDDLLELAHQRNKHELIDCVNALPGQAAFSAE
ncbi:MAG: alpha-glucan family phosphorylase, partial [Chloroflexota bacterium]